MKFNLHTLILASLVLTLGFAIHAGDLTAGMKKGKAELQSAGPLAFGPQGILFVADPKAASIFAIATSATSSPADTKSFKVKAVNEKIAALLGTSADQILIHDLAVNPKSHHAYLSVSRGRGTGSKTVILRAEADGTLKEFSLDSVKFSQAKLPNAPEDKEVQRGRRRNNPRMESITDLAYLDWSS